MKSLVWLLCFYTGVVSAQGLTLSDAISEAKNNSPDLRMLQAKADRLSWAKFDALSTYLPHISASYEHYFDSHYMREGVIFGGQVVNMPAAYPQNTFNIDAEITLFDGLGGIKRFQSARLNAEAADLDLKHASTRLEQAVRNAYYQALASQKLAEVAEQNVKTLENHLSRAKITEKAGYGTGFDVMRIEATLEEARAEKEAAENNVHITRDSLTELLGKKEADDRPLKGELPVFNSNDISKNIAIEIENRDDVQAQLKRDAASEKAATAAHAFWFPSLSVFADEQYYQFGNFDPLIQPNDNYQHDWAVGLRLKWNLFDGGHSYAQQREAVAAAAEARAQTEKVLTQLPREIDTWKRKFDYSVSLYKARLRAVTQFQESVRLAGIGLRAGTRTHTEMLDAELDLFRARGGLVRAQADAIEALGKLELASGHTLWKAPN